MMIYFDNASTTRVSKVSANAALSAMTENFGNPSSLHRLGIAAEDIISESAGIIAGILGASEDEIIFTGSGTEANNLAIRGALEPGKRNYNKFIYDAVEHESVVGIASYLQKEGYEVVAVPPREDGSADTERIIESVDGKTGLVSLMLVNNETGSLTDVSEAVKKIKRKNPNTKVHIDCVAAFCKTDCNVKPLGAELVTISGHKIHAPKGVGAVYIKRGVRLLPIMSGSGQQRGIRPGTESVPLIAAFGAAARESYENSDKAVKKISEINKFLREEIGKIESAVINSPADASPFVLNFSTCAVKSEIMLHFLEGYEIYLSSGSACAKGEKSHVLKGMGLKREIVDTALRISFCDENTLEEAKVFIKAINDGLARLKRSYK